MNPHLQRALLLIEQGRHEMADREARQSLAEHPHDAMSHSVLALCLVNAKKYQEASEEAALAIHHEPDNPFGHYTQAVVFFERNRYREAEQAIAQAISLNPYVVSYYALWGSLHLAQSRWQQALEAAEEGLACDPEDVDCTNIRAQALKQLRRPGDAAAVIGNSLARAPENATSHALMGWTLVEQGEYQKAMEHFREALRLEPDSELARSGIIEALKAKRVIYRPFLKYFLWISKFSGRGQWGIILGLWFVMNVLRRMARANPELAPFVLPLSIAYGAFAFSTWMAVPLFNLLLLLDPFGRLVLSRHEKITSSMVGICVLGALLCVAGYFAITPAGWLIPATVVCVLLIPPISQIYHCEAGWPRMLMAAVALGMLGIGILAVAGIAFADSGIPRDEEAVRGGAQVLLAGFVLAAFGSQFIANALAGLKPKR
jgi:tetratricopeptide (TPR) repeat protein